MALVLSWALVLLAQATTVSPFCPGAQVRAFSRPFPFGIDPPPAERKVDEQFFTFQELIPDDVTCPSESLCLVARPQIARRFFWNGGEYLGFELVLANPTRHPIRLVFPGVLPIVRQTLTNGWVAVEAQPCWPWCGNSVDAVDLRAGYCFRFPVPVYGGDLKTRQRFHAILSGGLLASSQRYELISNDFESFLSPAQLVPISGDCGLGGVTVDTRR